MHARYGRGEDTHEMTGQRDIWLLGELPSHESDGGENEVGVSNCERC